MSVHVSVRALNARQCMHSGMHTSFVGVFAPVVFPFYCVSQVVVSAVSVCVCGGAAALPYRPG